MYRGDVRIHEEHAAPALQIDLGRIGEVFIFAEGGIVVGELGRGFPEIYRQFEALPALMAFHDVGGTGRYLHQGTSGVGRDLEPAHAMV